MSTSLRDFAKRQLGSASKADANTNSTKKETINSCLDEKIDCRIKEKKISSNQENKNSTVRETKKSRIEEKKSEDDGEQVKNVAVNMTLREDYDIALKVLAARRRVRPWVILNEALGRYLREAKAISEKQIIKTEL